MLMAAWKGGGMLPNDDAQLAQVAKMTPQKWRASSHILRKFFKPEGEQLVHKRVTAERIRAQEISDAKAVNGRKGGSKKKQNGSKTEANAIAIATANEVANDKLTGTPLPIPITDAKASGGKPPSKSPEEQSKTELWQSAVSLLAGQGVPEPQARSLIGKLVKDYDTAGSEIVITAVRGAVAEQPADARAYIKATCQRLAGERKRDGGADWTASAT
jgi:hypothetical protein